MLLLSTPRPGPGTCVIKARAKPELYNALRRRTAGSRSAAVTTLGPEQRAGGSCRSARKSPGGWTARVIWLTTVDPDGAPLYSRGVPLERAELLDLQSVGPAQATKHRAEPAG